MNEKRKPPKPETRGQKNTLRFQGPFPASFPKSAIRFPDFPREQVETVSGKCVVVSQRFRSFPYLYYIDRKRNRKFVEATGVFADLIS